MNKADSPSMPMQAPTTAQGNILLYLPWEFDMLGGVDVVVDRLWKGLETTMPGRAIIGIQDWHVQGEKTDTEGRRFLHLNMPAPPANNGLAGWRYCLTSAKRLPRLLRTLKQHKITAVNVHFPTLNTYLLALLKHLGLWRGCLVLSFHGSDVNDIDLTCPHWRLIARYADATTACSTALAQRVDSSGLFGTPTRVIYNGIDCNGFAQLAECVPQRLETNQPYILNVGNYVSHKGQDVLFKAFARITTSHPDLRLICVGGTNDGVWLQYLKNLSSTEEVENHVILLENQPQPTIAALMRKAICLVHTSHREGLPLVLLEAAACFTPIVATNVGGVPEIIPSDEFGLLVDAGDPEAVTAKLGQVLAFPDRATRMATMLHQRVKDFFSVEGMVSAYRDALLGNEKQINR